MKEAAKVGLYVIIIVAGVVFLIWIGASNSNQKKPANIFSLERDMHGKWSDVKQEITVYFFGGLTFHAQKGTFEPLIGTYKIISSDKELFLKFDTGKEIIINKFIISDSYDENGRMLSFTLESINANNKKQPLTLRRKPTK